MAWEYSIKIGGYTYNYGDVIYVKGNGYLSAYAGASVGINYGENYRTRFYGVYSASGVIDYPICVGESSDGTSATANYFISANQIVSGGTPDTFAYSFDANGGTGAPSAMTKTYGVHFTFPTTKPTLAGHTFVGWYNDSVNNGTVYSAGEQVIGLPDRNITWYASWRTNEYTMTVTHHKYNPVTDKWDIIATTYDSALYGSTYTPPYSKTPTGYHNHARDWDGGWTVSGNGGFSVYYYPNTYTMTVYHNKYNAVTEKWERFNTTYDSALYGSVFVPSYVNAPSGFYKRSIDHSSGWTVTGNGSFNAYYYPNKYTLTINPNRGEWNESSDSQKFSQLCGSIKAIPNPTREGYTFSEWTLDGSGSLSGMTYTYGAGNATLTAVWSQNKYIVTFDGNSGTTPENSRSIYYGVTIGTLPIATKKYHKFVGWFTAPTGGIQITSSYVVTGNITLYAHYVEDNIIYTCEDDEIVAGHVYVLRNGAWVEGKKVCVLKNGQWVSGISG